MAFGCDENAIDHLTGKYPVPESIELTTLAELFRASKSDGSSTVKRGSI